MKVHKSISKHDSLKALKTKAFNYASEDDETYTKSKPPYVNCLDSMICRFSQRLHVPI